MIKGLTGKVHLQFQELSLEFVGDDVLNVEREGLAIDRSTMEKGFYS